MPGVNSNTLPWELAGQHARFRYGPLVGNVNLALPQCGVDAVIESTRKVAMRLLAVSRIRSTPTPQTSIEHDAARWPLAVAEAYQRGDDVVAQYLPEVDWPFSPQIYWRANTFAANDQIIASLSLLISVQTQLLDTYPEIEVSTVLPPGKAFTLWFADRHELSAKPVVSDREIEQHDLFAGILFQFDDLPFSYVEFSHAGDFRKVSLRVGRHAFRTKWNVFDDFLEKGVILRARVHAALLPRESDLELAVQCVEESRQFKLPLTA